MHFYATREDLVPVIRGVEAVGTFKYVLCGLHSTRALPEYLSALDIPSLGYASNDSAPVSSAYLVIPSHAKVVVREVPQDTGAIRYAIDQLQNPFSATFQPGGRFGDTVLLYGRVATVARTKEGRSILRLFETRIKKYFEKHEAFYVGPEAARLKEQGVRLTLAVQSPPEFSLR